MADDANPRAVIGANNPPADPFEAISAAIEDNLVEAHNWADGYVLETQAQADELSFLIDRLRKDGKAADDARVAEKRPWDDGAKAVQTKWKPLLDRVDKATLACKATLGVYLKAQEAAKQEAARIARAEADEAARKAAETARAADPSNLAEQERAEAAIEAAEAAAKAAKRAEGDRAQATGGTRAMGLRSVWHVEVADPAIAMRTMWGRHREEVLAFALQLAQRDVREGKRALDGFTITEDRVPV